MDVIDAMRGRISVRAYLDKPVSRQTLEQVLDHYSEGVRRTETLDPNLAKHPDGGLKLTAEEKRCVIAFLKTLTDGGLEGRMTKSE